MILPGERTCPILRVSVPVGEIFLNAGNPYPSIGIPQQKFPRTTLLMNLLTVSVFRLYSHTPKTGKEIR